MDSMFHTNEENEEVDQRLLHDPRASISVDLNSSAPGTKWSDHPSTGGNDDVVGDFDGDFDGEVGAGDSYIRSPFNRCQYPQKNPFSNHHWVHWCSPCNGTFWAPTIAVKFYFLYANKFEAGKLYVKKDEALH